jgi:uncharacterized protein YbjT (DUF2867 family)
LSDTVSGLDACFFCLGVSSAGLGEAAYTRVTYDLTLAVAGFLAPRNPAMTFVYVSGMGTDATERGRSMWARVKGRTENALRTLPFKAVHLFRPALIIPPPGVVPKSKVYRAFYAVARPFLPLVAGLAPAYVTTAEEVGRAMVRAAAEGYPEAVLESVDIRRFGA